MALSWRSNADERAVSSVPQAHAGIENATFGVGDATATQLETASVDGAIARFTIHHLPVPRRLVEELARVVRPGGTSVLADDVARKGADAFAWSQEIANR